MTRRLAPVPALVLAVVLGAAPARAGLKGVLSGDVDLSFTSVRMKSALVHVDPTRYDLRALVNLALEDEAEEAPSPWDFYLGYQLTGLDSVPPGDAGLEVDPYRYWARYMKESFELRLGLQKIVFGHGRYLRPLALFDSIDPRDFTRRTPGVKAARLRWFPSREQEVLGWVIHNRADGSRPHRGGRVNRTFRGLEAGLTYHRWEDDGPRRAETVLGLDAFADVTVGLWLEHASHRPEVGEDHARTSLGVDYTFAKVGNGLHVGVEHLVQSSTLAQPRTRVSAVFWDTRLTAEDTLSGAFFQDGRLGARGVNLRWLKDIDEHLNGELSLDWSNRTLDELQGATGTLPVGRSVTLRVFYAF